MWFSSLFYFYFQWNLAENLFHLFSTKKDSLENEV